ncbi:DUF4190 domain-containing protein [Streptomyces sp. CC219B]|uniref:DUF4190 domain-containing protein n=1 Tax=Streptomyces sp. CC219B TaxID=3044574 RepID=UPI0024A81CEC|nr:DUF4190 domain-containing protein [Streptomyces sp. CC219B]
MSIPPPPGPQQPQGPQGPYGPPGPQGPYPQGPYGHHFPYGYGYGRPAPVNGVAIAALVLGILCFLPAVGLVLGLIALRQIGRKGERGKGMAVAGSVLSAVGLALWTVSLSTGALGEAWDDLKNFESDATYALAKGDCFDAPSGFRDGAPPDVDEVPCAGRHDGEVFGVVELPGGTYPGEDEVTRTAEKRCDALASAYALDYWAVPEEVGVYYLYPTGSAWRLGDREVTCVFASAEKGATLDGSLRTDATTLDADQLALLKALNAVDDVLFEEPEDYPEDDLAGSRAWAGDVEEVLGEQIAELREHTWPKAAEQPVADLVADMDDARKAWAKAAATDDVDTFYEHYESGYAFVDGRTTVTARKALGLATTVPSYEDYEEGGAPGAGGGELDV